MALQSIRAKEIQRLQKYSQGLGISVSFKNHSPGLAGATWTVAPDNTVELILYTWKNQTKTQIILNFLHELAHHMAWVYQGREFTEELANILNKNYEGVPLTKKERYAVFKEERDDAVYRLQIAKEIGIKVPEWKITVDCKLDEWIYYYWYKNDKYPTDVATKEKRKELTNVYRPKSKN
jgi:hypothetical protein